VLTFPFLDACIIFSIPLLAPYLVATTLDIIWDNIGVANWPYIELNVVSLCTLKPLISRLFRNFLPTAEHPNCDNFTAGINVEIGNFALVMVDGSTSRSNSTGMSESETDMICKEEILGVLEVKENNVVLRLKGAEDKQA